MCWVLTPMVLGFLSISPRNRLLPYLSAHTQAFQPTSYLSQDTLVFLARGAQSERQSVSISWSQRLHPPRTVLLQCGPCRGTPRFSGWRAYVRIAAKPRCDTSLFLQFILALHSFLKWIWRPPGCPQLSHTHEQPQNTTRRGVLQEIHLLHSSKTTEMPCKCQALQVPPSGSITREYSTPSQT